jgi:nucleoside-diphosphate-sugar epimerase
VDAESRLAVWCTSRGIALVVLRAPGIYASDRLPVERLRAGIPALRDEDDGYTNHIHADDLAAICVRALQEDAPAGIYNASDDTHLKMGAWLDLVADHAGLPRPPRIARAEAGSRIPAEVLSFMNESRRLDNTRLKRVLGVRLRYPTVREGLNHDHAAGVDQPA